MKLNVMITGATGLLGRAVVKQLEQSESYRVLPCGFSRAGIGVHRIDLTQAEAVQQFIATQQPDMIIHCAAERRPDVSEQSPEAALALNVRASSNLAKAAKANGAWLLYISTDYVFDGTKPDYPETAEPSPVNFYGESKWQGERAVLAVDNGFAILRLPILYGAVEQLAESAVLVLLKQLLDSSPQRQDDWAIRSPTSTLDIAGAIEKLLNRQQERADVKGIYHFSALERMTKYQMLQRMAAGLDLSCDHISPVSMPSDNAKRPRDCSLSCQRLADLGIFSQVNFEQGIKQSLANSSNLLIPSSGYSRFFMTD
ncbi:SDR family oxidoreductase [Shewanella sp. Isolate11]|uniref:dTDP-4-dehydrorhamnose reductase family protein n=1 Tax=Shewanella sp. Isolate11 TaxID=2908530 RepID=UPI001EFE90FA|nr:SDR family oxidoreductase [Shewanella sp. Isolate11]MCG9698206.1 SDR family oxidoreductase [Shewanella sp. Isolate11]